MAQLGTDQEREQLRNILSRYLPAGSAPAATPNMEQLAQTYASQLQALNDMGFFDREENLRVLIQVNGNVSAAIERLLNR